MIRQSSHYDSESMTTTTTAEVALKAVKTAEKDVAEQCGNRLLNELGQRAYNNAKTKGFHDEPQNIATLLMLIITEISEACEADRKGKRADMRSFKMAEASGRVDFSIAFNRHIKDSFEDELADVLLRLVGLAAIEGIDLDAHVAMKMRYNTLREYRHGKNY